MRRNSMMPIWRRWKKTWASRTRRDSQRKADQAMAFLEEEELTEDMKEKLIEKVIVYPGNRIEIVWKFEGHLNN